MRQIGLWVALAALVCVGVASSVLAFGRGGAARGGATAGGYRGAAAVGPYGGSAAGARAGATVVGPAGGSAGYRAGAGTVTTPRGGTIQAGGAAAGGVGPAG